MATIGNDPNGRKRVLFVAGDGTRKTIRLGKMDRKNAERFCGRVEKIISANISGGLPTSDPDVVEKVLGDRVDFLLDAGPTPGGAASTIVDVTGAEPRLIRDGAISWDAIQTWLNTARA